MMKINSDQPEVSDGGVGERRETERLSNGNPDRARQTSPYPGHSFMRGASGNRVPKASLYAVSLIQIHREPHTSTNAHFMISHSSSHDK